jgi:hypothetical protein
MLKSILLGLFFSMFFSSCVSSDSQGVFLRGEKSIQLIDSYDQYFQVVFFNGTDEDYALDGIIGPGYVQSSVKYKVKGEKNKHYEKAGGSMPILLDPVRYRINLMSGSTYGFVVDKREFLQINDLKEGACYAITAMYSPPATNYSTGKMISKEKEICFGN